MIMIFMVNQISILIDTLCWWPTELASTPSSPLSRWHHERPLSCPELGLPTWLGAMATMSTMAWPVQGQTRVTSEPRSVKQRQTKSSIVADCWLGLTCFVCVNCDLWVATGSLFWLRGVPALAQACDHCDQWWVLQLAGAGASHGSPASTHPGQDPTLTILTSVIDVIIKILH